MFLTPSSSVHLLKYDSLPLKLSGLHSSCWAPSTPWQAACRCVCCLTCQSSMHLLNYDSLPLELGGHSSFWVPLLLGAFYIVAGCLQVCSVLASESSMHLLNYDGLAPELGSLHLTFWVPLLLGTLHVVAGCLQVRRLSQPLRAACTCWTTTACCWSWPTLFFLGAPPAGRLLRRGRLPAGACHSLSAPEHIASERPAFRLLDAPLCWARSTSWQAPAGACHFLLRQSNVYLSGLHSCIWLPLLLGAFYVCVNPQHLKTDCA